VGIVSRKRVSADVHEVQLSPLDIEATYLVLPGPLPVTSYKVTLDVVGLGAQAQNVDYQIIDNKVQWTALGLETLISAGDRLRLVYHY